MEGEELRDQGIKEVVDHAGKWSTKARRAMERMPKGWIGIGEELRLIVVKEVGEPHHPNAWGGIIMGLVRRGVYEYTGLWRKCKTAKAHAHQTRELIKIGEGGSSVVGGDEGEVDPEILDLMSKPVDQVEMNDGMKQYKMQL